MIRFPRADERGLTTIEMIVAVAISAIISVPLGLGLYEAFTAIPRSSARSQQAAARFFLTDAFARDVANAANVTVPADGTSSWDCPSATTTSTQEFFEATWTDGTAVTVNYTATFSVVAGSSRLVDITRTENGVPAPVATGYCDSTAGAAITVTNSLVEGDLHRRVHAKLMLSPRPELPVEVTDLEGALGKTK